MICNWQYIPLIYHLIIYHLSLVTATRNSYWKMADVSCFYFCAEFCFLPFPFRKKYWGKTNKLNPPRRQDFDQKTLHAGSFVMLPFETPISDLLIQCLEKVRTHILLNGGHCWWWFIMVQSLNNHLLTKQIQVITKTKLQMGHLNSIFLLVVFFQRIKVWKNFRPHRIASIPCITHHIELQGPPTKVQLTPGVWRT